MAKKLVNPDEDVVEEMICGILACHPNVTRLEGSHVLLRSDFLEVREREVTLISGGGSGHEPSHAGWLGKSMLTAAVCGGVFASPSVGAVLSAIRACAGPAGVLVIVKNYTGDRLNFGLACEQAKAEGILCEMVIVGDDCAVVDRDEDKIAGRRGIAGTVFVHKCAGAAAAAGAPLSEVLAIAQAAEGSVGSVGTALDVCTLPGQAKNIRLGPNDMELGLGIHGEPGTQTLPMQPADQVTDRMLDMICDPSGGCRWRGGLQPGETVVLLVNNLGSTPLMEMYIVARRALAKLAAQGVHVARVFVGAFMTSLDMTGVSLTLLKVDRFQQLFQEAVLQRNPPSLSPGWLPLSDPLPLLDSMTTAPAWPAAFAQACVPPAPAAPMPAAPAADTADSGCAPPGPAVRGPTAATIETAVRAGLTAIIAAESELTQWDAICGDGDCGATMRKGAEQILSDMRGYAFTHPAKLSAQLAASIGTMGGTSGVILDIFFRALGNSLSTAQPSASSGLTPALVAALGAGIQAITFYGGAKAGMRTMLDALVPAHAAASACIDTLAAASASADGAAADATPAVVQALAQGARIGAESTKTMVAVAGRASYVPAEQVSGVPDPGAMAVAAALGAIAKSVAPQ